LKIINREQNFMTETSHEAMKKWPMDSHHEVAETYANAIGISLFDGHSLKLEFIVARAEEPHPPAKLTGTRHIVARMVLSIECAIDLINQMHQIGAQLAQAGLIKVGQPGER